MSIPPATPPATLARARQIARAHGLQYVYNGNVHDRGSTSSPGCGATLIVRDWCRIVQHDLDEHGSCQACGKARPGRFGKFRQGLGHRRVPVPIATA